MLGCVAPKWCIAAGTSQQLLCMHQLARSRLVQQCSGRAMSTQMTLAQLRELFLFADLTDEQLTWVAENADEVEVPADTDVFAEGDEARCFYVLLSGTVATSRQVGGERVETGRTDQVG